MMKRLTTVILSLVTMVLLLGTDAYGKDDVSKHLGYVSTSISWQDGVVLEGYFCNTSDTYDIYELSDATITLIDGDGVKALTFNLKDSDMKNVVIPNGKSSNMRIISSNNFNGADYNLKNGYQTALSCNFKYQKCGGSNCSICNGSSFQYVPPQNNASQNLQRDSYYPYYPETAPTQAQMQCPICHGEKKVDCTSCNGLGYFPKTNYSIDLGSGSTKYETKITCGTCNGSKKMVCHGCWGTGKVN